MWEGRGTRRDHGRTKVINRTRAMQGSGWMGRVTPSLGGVGGWVGKARGGVREGEERGKGRIQTIVALAADTRAAQKTILSGGLSLTLSAGARNFDSSWLALSPGNDSGITLPGLAGTDTTYLLLDHSPLLTWLSLQVI